MNVLGSPDFVTPFLGAGVHGWVEVRVVEDDGVRIDHGPNRRAATVGQDAAEHLSAPVKLLHVFLQVHNIRIMSSVGNSTIKTLSKSNYA